MITTLGASVCAMSIGFTPVDAGKVFDFIHRIDLEWRMREHALCDAAELDPPLRCVTTKEPLVELLGRDADWYARLYTLAHNALGEGHFERFCTLAWIFASRLAGPCDVRFDFRTEFTRGVEPVPT